MDRYFFYDSIESCTYEFLSVDISKDTTTKKKEPPMKRSYGTRCKTGNHKPLDEEHFFGK
jgi:hypothetical protein